MLSKDIESNDDNNERPDRPVKSYGEISRSTGNVEASFFFIKKKRATISCLPDPSKKPKFRR